ncbi:Class i alpha-mannosidase [Lasiodiplodia theobromae]|uniref:Class i alpha-mannosidase n=1 Tax=Lasiodiplodia theobromae TaxID=45133 RepID=UPI0015C2DF71|nr:Class i alpha-mannosidase [Lasiodiplodia theobromae]KAF4536222.1 Class i alpha-mannosidase [Lasiodiplodia theobromae]
MFARRKTVFVFVAFAFLFYYFHGSSSPYRLPYGSSGKASPAVKPAFDWANVTHRYPVATMASMPSSVAHPPLIQHQFEKEDASDRKVRLERQQKVKKEFLHAWNGYRKHAWMHDELLPISGGARDPFGGWAATLVDSLDTLWIMNLTDEFDEAVHAVNQIDFSTCSLEEINVFETTIRYLGGLLAAYDLSGGQYPSLLTKATELGHMLYKAFDTPNRMPITRWNMRAAMQDEPQEAATAVLVAEIGSLTMEFTRLSQLTGDLRWFDAVQRITDVFEAQQMHSKLQGLFPTVVNARTQDFWSTDAAPSAPFTIGGMVDSLYEYFPKQHLLLHGASRTQYRKLWLRASSPIRGHLLYRPLTPGNKDILLAGDAHVSGGDPPAFAPKSLLLEPKNQHLSCFAGGMFALAGRAFGVSDDVATGKRLTEGCLWAYEAGAPHGIMPETMYTLPCPQTGPFSGDGCEWAEDWWFDAVEAAHNNDVNRQAGQAPQFAEDLIQRFHLRKGVAKVADPRYILRPEAIESAFVTYRITGDERLPERAWRIFEKIIKNTKTRYGHASLDDCVSEGRTRQGDRMESFWLAETLKYFYLMFEEPGVLSLDEWVFNTEAHPFRWAKGGAGGVTTGP